MINKLIKGGLKKTNPITYENYHKLDNENKITYAKIDVVTNDIVDNNQKNFTLYKFFNVIMYNKELFNLPKDINIKNIYLFGFHNGFVDNFFVKKNKDVIEGTNALRDYTNTIGASLKKLYEDNEINKYLEIILVHYKDENNSGLYIIFNTTSFVDKYYNKLKKSFVSNFIDDDNLKKQLKFSNLNNLIKFTNEYLPPPTSTTNLKTEFLLSLLFPNNVQVAEKGVEGEDKNGANKQKTQFILSLFFQTAKVEANTPIQQQSLASEVKSYNKLETEFLLKLFFLRANEDTQGEQIYEKRDVGTTE